LAQIRTFLFGVDIGPAGLPAAVLEKDNPVAIREHRSGGLRNANLDRQEVGFPKWAQPQTYSVSAKPAPELPMFPPNENREQVRRMMHAGGPLSPRGASN
jgi:hypothetical protein